MEKFGIFELLDALSAVTAPEEEASSPAGGEENMPPAHPDPRENAFAPPRYGAPSAPTEPAAPQKNAAAAFPPREEAPNAVSSLLDRHERISRRIDGKK